MNIHIVLNQLLCLFSRKFYSLCFVSIFKQFVLFILKIEQYRIKIFKNMILKIFYDFRSRSFKSVASTAKHLVRLLTDRCRMKLIV